MQYGGDGVAVRIIKIDSQLNCTGIVGGRSCGSRLRMQRDFTGNGLDVGMWINRRSYSSSGQLL